MCIWKNQRKIKMLTMILGEKITDNCYYFYICVHVSYNDQVLVLKSEKSKQNTMGQQHH